MKISERKSVNCDLKKFDNFAKDNKLEDKLKKYKEFEPKYDSYICIESCSEVDGKIILPDSKKEKYHEKVLVRKRQQKEVLI